VGPSFGYLIGRVPVRGAICPEPLKIGDCLWDVVAANGGFQADRVRRDLTAHGEAILVDKPLKDPERPWVIDVRLVGGSRQGRAEGPHRSHLTTWLIVPIEGVPAYGGHNDNDHDESIAEPVAGSAIGAWFALHAQSVDPGKGATAAL
jgi:hypothetical protein